MMPILTIFSSLIVFAFLFWFAADDLRYREIKNENVAMLLVAVLCILAIKCVSGDITYEFCGEVLICASLMCLIYGKLHLIGGADFKIVTTLTLIYGPWAVFSMLMAAILAIVWKKAFVKDGMDTFFKLKWTCIPLMFFYLIVFGCHVMTQAWDSIW